VLIFNQIALLPIAYFIVLMCVVCTGVTAKLLAPLLIEVTSGSLQKLLSLRINIALTADEIIYHLFEQQLWANANKRIFLTLVPRMTRLPESRPVQRTNWEMPYRLTLFFPEKHWSGCPPNAA
jgi:hypothetical protein